MEDNTLDFNFWPSFSDLMLTLVLILVIVVFAVIAAFSIGTDDLRAELQKTKKEMAKVEKEQKEIAEAIAKVKEKQKKIIEAIAEAYDTDYKEVENDAFKIRLEDDGDTEILIRNEATLQRYSFSDRILFEPDEYYLSEDGKDTLLTVGHQITNNLNSISEIQIQGHADPDPPAFEPSNLHLAAKRSIEVFQFLQKKIRIDPAKHLMSATSFGEYKPVQRLDADRSYTQEKIDEDNKTKELKAKNRRMEILLFYRFEQADE